MAKLKQRSKCADKSCTDNRLPNSKFCKKHRKIVSKKKYEAKIRTRRHKQLARAGPTVARLVEEMKKNDEYLNIDENIAIMSMIMRKNLERAERQGGIDAVLDRAKQFFIMLEKINRSLLTKAKIEEGLKHKIDIEVIDVALKQMLDIVKKHVSNPLTLRAIADNFAEVKVHDTTMRRHKPRDHYLKKLEETNMETRDMMEKMVVDRHLEKNVKKNRRKIKFALDK